MRRPQYDPSRHHIWTHDFKAYLRAAHPFGLQIVMGIHTRPPRPASMEEEDAPEQQRVFATGADDIASTLAIEPLTSDEDEEDHHVNQIMKEQFEMAMRFEAECIGKQAEHEQECVALNLISSEMCSNGLSQMCRSLATNSSSLLWQVE